MKSKKYLLSSSTIIIYSLLISCSRVHINHQKPHSVGLESAYKELSFNKSRNLASDTPKPIKDINFSIDDFKEINVMLFPKINEDNMKNGEAIDPNDLIKNINSKESSDQIMQDFIDYDRPQFFRLSKVESQSCFTVRRNTEYDAQDFFGDKSNFKDNKDLKCLIVKVVRKTKTKADIPRKYIIKGDILEIDLYFDEYYRPYGKRIIYATKDKNKDQHRVVKIRHAQTDSFTSDLTEFPIDLPNLASPIVQSNWSYKGTSPLRTPSSKYVQNFINKKYTTPKCSNGFSLSSKNILGQSIHTGWCKDSSFPTTINTSNYFAIIKK